MTVPTVAVAPWVRRAGPVLLATVTWAHLLLVVWVCFLLPNQGDWGSKLESARAMPVLAPMIIATLLAAWMCRRHLRLLIAATTIATFDGLIWASQWWL